jgi:hypothetical protein
MKKTLLIVLICLIFQPQLTYANYQREPIKAAFVRNGVLWIKVNGKEEQITKEPVKNPYEPHWSHDGKWVLYFKEQKEKLNPNMGIQKEIWVYNVENKKHIRITYDGRNPKWSPIDDTLAFQSDGVLNVSNLKKFYNVALGVDDYNWFPDGSGFIASSSASLHPDGWTNPKLYKITLNKPLDQLNSLTKNVKPLYVIPNELKKEKVSILSINATSFHFSPDGKWISFIVSPTASWSMDSDMVCIISAEGKNFEPLDEVIFGVTGPKWAPNKNLLGYIAGGGRIVFGFKNKEMKVSELPAFKTLSLTPPHFAELGFGWKDNLTLYVSRVKEAEWSNESNLRPDPSLFLIKLNSQTQTQISWPPRGFGDYHPSYISSASKLIWERKKDIADSKVDAWIAEPNGQNAKIWLKNIDSYSIYEQK